jgi:hypothetical protein
MILAWVISLLLLCATLVGHLEYLTALQIIELKTVERSQNLFIQSEQAVLACENNLNQLISSEEDDCFIELVAKDIWLITSKQKPAIQTHVHLDAISGVATRLNWRQVFE